MPKSPGKSKKAKALLLGVGLDSDGHKRVTTGPNFALLGGTKETHEVMTEKAIKINEKLAARGKKLEEVSREEFDDIRRDSGAAQAAVELGFLAFSAGYGSRLRASPKPTPPGSAKSRPEFLRSGRSAWIRQRAPSHFRQW
jgi:hypothetical protein